MDATNNEKADVLKWMLGQIYRAEKRKKFSKWFFYWFYPLHLLILGILRIAGEQGRI